VRSVVKASITVLAAALFLSGCSGDADGESSPKPLAKASVNVKDAELPTLTGAYGQQPTIAFPLRQGQSSPSPTPSPSEEPLIEGEQAEPAEDDAAPPAEPETPDDAQAPVEGAEPAEVAPVEQAPVEAETTPESAAPAEAATPEAASPSPSATPESPYVKPPASLQVQVQPDMEGDAADSVKADNLVSVDMVAWEWGETEPLASLNTFASGAPLVIAIRSDNSSLEGLSRVIVGQNVGSRLLGVIPPSEGSLASLLNLDEGTTLVVAVDIRQQFDKDAQAQKDAKAAGAQTGPKIHGALGGPATVSIPADVPEPTAISTTVIATGSGPAVEDGQQYLVHYSATDWAGKSDGDTWKDDRGPAPVTVTANPLGDDSVLTVFSGLAGVPVGSRVLIITPGKEGSYLAEAIVVDIVALIPGNEPIEPAQIEGTDGTETTEGTEEPVGDAQPEAVEPGPDPSE
jgi:peptidylprolyl isomerase